jgi:EAL domain-containing protein (putative c-di-GMP-specific phosphodiesterase class I)
VARIGGDKFVIFLADYTSDEALKIIKQQLKIISDYQFIWESTHFSVTFSTSLVNFNSSQDDASLLLQSAESTCQLAKDKGSNNMHISHIDDELHSNRKKIMHWVSRIDESLEDGSLSLRYQPITPINIEKNPHKHAEILLGLNDEHGNPTSPEHYVLAAEKYGRMADIDRWVIKNAFQWMISNRDKMDEIGGFAINLSGVSLNDDNFAAYILDQINKTKVPTDLVCFEITETAGIGNLSDAVQFIEEIKKTGCSFSLDDFGTGLSSYAYLKNLPVDFLKIDGSFIKDIENNPSDVAVVKSITEIGHFMEKKIIAECVEQESTIKLLEDLGVDYVQGWAIAKPKYLKDLE